MLTVLSISACYWKDPISYKNFEDLFLLFVEHYQATFYHVPLNMLDYTGRVESRKMKFLIYTQRLVDAQVILDSPELVPVVLMRNMLIQTKELLKFKTSTVVSYNHNRLQDPTYLTTLEI